MSTASSFRKPLLILSLVAAGGLTGCVTDPNTGEQHFNPWKGLQKADDSVGHMLDKANSSPDPRAPDWWNPD